MPVRKVCFKWHLNGAIIVKIEDKNLLIPLCTEPIFTKLVIAEKVFVNISRFKSDEKCRTCRAKFHFHPYVKYDFHCTNFMKL